MERRDKITGTLQSGKALEGDTRHLVLLDHGAAAVAGINGCIGLSREESAVADMNITFHLMRETTPRV